jgi:hypothetical protein
MVHISIRIGDDTSMEVALIKDTIYIPIPATENVLSKQILKGLWISLCGISKSSNTSTNEGPFHHVILGSRTGLRLLFVRGNMLAPTLPAGKKQTMRQPGLPNARYNIPLTGMMSHS